MNRRSEKRLFIGSMLGLLLAILLTDDSFGQPAAVSPGVVIAPAPRLEKLFTGAKFTEGPAIGPDGAIYFSDIPNSLILRHDPTTGQTATHQSHTMQANGLAFDAAGGLIACRGQARDVARLEADGTWSPRVASSSSRRLNCPNDLAIDPTGGIVFTDPKYRAALPDDSPVEGVYYQPAGDSPCRLLLSTLAKPNGIALSPDGQRLFVADWKGEKVVQYAWPMNGDPVEQRTFAAPAGLAARFMPDGIKVDGDGILYAASPAAALAEKGGGGIWIFNRQGSLTAIYLMPENPTNLAILRTGDQTWLYVTAQKSLYRLAIPR